jgi:hypothetical protein
MHEGGGGCTKAGVGGGRGRLLLAMEGSSLPIKLNPHSNSVWKLSHNETVACSRLSVAASAEIDSSRPRWLFLSCAGAGSCMK